MLSKLNSFSSFSYLEIGPFIDFKWNLRVELERFQYMEGQESIISCRDMETRHHFHFWAQIPMYTGCSGANHVYACFIVGKVHTCGKNIFLAMGFAKRDENSA